MVVLTEILFGVNGHRKNSLYYALCVAILAVAVGHLYKSADMHFFGWDLENAAFHASVIVLLLTGLFYFFGTNDRCPAAPFRAILFGFGSMFIFVGATLLEEGPRNTGAILFLAGIWGIFRIFAEGTSGFTQKKKIV